MNKLSLIAVSFVAIASSGVFTNAFAQEKTRAEVRQELIQAENDGLRFVTDASYPDVSPIYAHQVAQMKAQDTSGVGAAASGASSSGTRAPMSSANHSASCVGPVSFCSLYFGS
ncbi:DUF4148 domain-containing protein [Paraburkholderia megapolitana]|uniref:DUF4148 domain-containing protein n=1 Tax=Paraburkholderia megapolitana TaxID=420953 RepID=A0A1I3IJI7_9BURK|nr:DUF4148 domain-containing protein [Paraburkholderia megapolitana]QDQ85168.1 DUF4148 domain-containing protein [Paraburkholderia megapolitana]SFI48072.1 protein of unknown function [Paraburkholderia megapolitana]